MKLAVRKVLRGVYYVGAIIVFVTVAIAAFTQTRVFRSSLRDFILSNSQKLIAGRLTIGRIQGNLITGVSVDSVELENAGAPLFYADRIEFHYDPLAFLLKRAAISRVTVQHPTIQLYRQGDGRWNFDRLFLPTPPDTSKGGWPIDLRRVEIVGASMNLTDSLALLGRSAPLADSLFDYSRIRLKDLNLSAAVQIADDKYALQVKELTCSSSQPSVKISHVRGEFTVSNREVSVRNLLLETGRSRLKLDAAMRSVDIRHVRALEQLESAPVTVNLKVDNLDAGELKRFLYPWVDFLDRDFRLQIRCGGSFGKLVVEQGSVETPRSTLHFEGTIANLHRPKDLRLNVSSVDNLLNVADLREHLPGLQFPRLGSLDQLSCFFTFDGSPQTFKCHLAGTSNAGEVDAAATIDLTDGFRYDGDVRTEGFNLATLTGDEELQSSLDVHATVNGEGVEPDRITGIAKIQIDTSEFRGLSVDNTVLIADMNQGILHAHTSANLQSTRIDLTGKLQAVNGRFERYAFDGTVNSLDLEDFLKDQRYASDLSFGIKATGSVPGTVARHDTIMIHFLHSSYGDESFDSSTVALRYDALDSTRHRLRLNTDIADVDIFGEFTPPSIVNAFRDGGEIIGDMVDRRIQTLDSLRSPGSAVGGPGFVLSAPSTSDPVEARYDVRVKNLYPLGVFLQQRIAGSGTISGEIVGNADDMLVNGEATMNEGTYVVSRKTYGAQNATVKFYLDGLSRFSGTQSFSSSLDVHADEVRIDKTLLQNPSVTVMEESDSASFHCETLIDSTVETELEGTARVRDRLLDVDLSDFRVETGSYAFANTDPVNLTLGRDGVRVQDMHLAHGAEEVDAEGYFDPAGVSDLSLEIRGFLATNLRTILARSPLAQSVSEVGGEVNASLAFRGRFDRPELALNMRADGVRDRDRVLGSIETRASYAEKRLALFLKFRSRPQDTLTAPDLLLSGTLPYNFSLAGGDSGHVLGDLDLTLRSNGFRMEYLEPFIPELANLTGLMVCDMRMRGPIDAPLYEGTMSIQNARFLFKPLGIVYTLSGDFIPSGDRIRLENLVIRNIPQDRTDGLMKISGSFTMEGLKFKDFDLLATGQLLLMSESNFHQNQSLYGNLFAATGESGIRWQGSLAQSALRGDMVIKSASLVLPSERDVPTFSNRSVRVFFTDDTSRTKSAPAAQAVPKSEADRLLAQLTPSSSVVEPVETEHKSFLDAINYDIRIDMQGPTLLKFVFSSQTNEELFADLQGTLSFSKTPTSTQLTGEVQVGGRSYYNFFKKISATGTLLFTGDPLNPELNISARYEGVHDTSTVAGEKGKGEKVAVIIDITGTRKEPKPKMSLEIGGQKDTKRDAESDGISFILSNQFRDELSDQQRRGLLGTNVGYGLASGVLSGPLTEMLRRETGIIQSVDVLYYGGNRSLSDAADVRLTGQVGDAVIRFGGQIWNDLGNTNASVEVPMSSIVGRTELRNLILTLERRVEGVDINDERRTASNGARIFYRISF